MKRALIVLGLAAALLAASAASALGLTRFVTPSRNIACIGDSGEVRCDLKQHTFRAPAKPRACQLAWGDSYAVGRRGRGHGVCHGDTAIPGRGERARVLGYGKSIRVGRVVCTSRTAGLTCRNPGGHGFTISKQRLRLF